MRGHTVYCPKCRKYQKADNEEVSGGIRVICQKCRTASDFVRMDRDDHYVILTDADRTERVRLIFLEDVTRFLNSLAEGLGR